MDLETRAGSSVMKMLSSAQRREIHRLPLVGRYKPDVGLRICHQCEQSWAKTCFQASQKAVGMLPLPGNKGDPTLKK